MPSILGKRKHITKANGVNGHGKGTSQTIIQTVEEQIELERSMKLKEVEATEARIAWAKMLAAAVRNESTGTIASSYELVETAAMLSYWSIGSAYYSWSRPKIEPPAFSQSEDDAGSAEPTQPEFPPIEFPPLTNEGRLAIQSSLASGGKPLLVRYVVASGPEEVLVFLCCPACDRKDFSTVQGLYNHCRLSHQLTWAGHSDCIEACGYLVPEEDARKFGIEEAELKGTIPSLRRLFQRAVGVTPVQTYPIAQQELPPSRATPESRSPSPTPVPEAISSYANVTLGIHDETPALAPFLGTAVRRRQIKTFDVEDDIDIDDSADLAVPKLGVRPRWRMPNTFSVDTTDVDHNAEDSIPADEDTSGPPEAALPAPSRQERLSRFYISRRVRIKDRSCYIPAGRRPADMGNNSFLWSLTVTAPSYMPPLSTFLKEVAITVPADEDHPTVLSDPPFQANGQTREPFLARVRLSWAGDQNKDVNITHWVEVDVSHIGGWVEGDEQVLDVNLDKDTEFLPIRQERTKRRLKEDASVPEPVSRIGKTPGLSLDARLQKLVRRFPLTLDQRKGKIQVPYHLALDKETFSALPTGRQKSIEWQRARAIRLLAVQENHSASDPQLTTAGVLKWLTTGHMKALRRPEEGKGALEDPQTPSYCAYCGSRSQSEGDRAVCRFGCQDVAPQVDLKKSLTVRRMDRQLPHTSPSAVRQPTHAPRMQFAHSSRDLLESVDPSLTLGVLQAVTALRLSSFAVPSHLSVFPLDRFGLSHRQLEPALAPYALLAQVARAFIRRLVARSVQLSQVTATSAQTYASMRKQESGVKPEASDDAGPVRPKRSRGQQPQQYLADALTPTHVIYALSSPAWDAPYAAGFDILTGHGLGDVKQASPTGVKVEHNV